MLFSHGNAEDLGLIYDWFREFARALKVNVLAYDYTGYGLSQNEGERPSELMYLLMSKPFDYLANVLNIKPETMVLYGRSLGSALRVIWRSSR